MPSTARTTPCDRPRIESNTPARIGKVHLQPGQAEEIVVHQATSVAVAPMASAVGTVTGSPSLPAG